MPKADWLASESAPKDYPMEVIRGTFLYPGEEHGLYIPNGKVVYGGWGKPISTHVVGPDQKPLPDRLEITYYSFIEDQFYRGEFELPYDTIVRLFQEGYDNHKTPSSRMSYRRIIVGMAPGGQVAVWLAGAGKTTEVFFGQGEPIDYDWNRYWTDSFLNDNPQPREEYHEESLQEMLTPEEREHLETEGIPYDKWPRLRTLYPWQPKFFRMAGPTTPGSIEYANGELYHLRHPLSEKDAAKPRPIPREITFHSNGHLYIIYLDVDETLAAFEQMADGDTPLYLDIAPGLPRSETAIRLRNPDDEHIMLTGFTVDDLQ